MTKEEQLDILCKAFDWCLVGGNSLASNLIGLLGPNFHKHTRENIQGICKHTYGEKGWIEVYEQWCCWKALMEARDMVEKALGKDGWKEYANKGREDTSAERGIEGTSTKTLA